MLVTRFDATGNDHLNLSTDGHDVDYDDEVSVWLSGTRLGYLRTGPDNSMNGGDI